MGDGGAEGLGLPLNPDSMCPILQPGDVLVYVWYVHLCCESVGNSIGTQRLAVETQEHANYDFD